MVLAAMVAIAATTDQITIEIDGTTVRQAIERIAQICDRDLRVRDDANFNSLVVAVKDVRLDDLLQRIAKATGTVWEADGDQLTLVTTDESNVSVDREDTERRRRAIDRAKGLLEVAPRMEPREIEALASRAELIGKDLKVWIPTDEQRAVIAEIQSKKPIARLAQRIARELKTEELANVTREKPIVYSNFPVGTELAVPSATKDAFEDYKKEFAVWQSALIKSTAAFPVINPEDPRFGVTESNPPTAVHVSTEVLSERSYIRVIVRTADSAGNIVDTWFSVLRPEMANRHFMLEPDVTFPVPIVLRETRAFFLRQETISDETGVRTLSPDTSLRLRRPLAFDPVSLGIGPLLVAISTAAHKNLVACVTDFALDWYGWPGGLGNQWQANAAFSQIDTMWETDVALEDGWLLVTPRSYKDSRSKYYDRRALSRLFEKQEANRMISLEDATSYAGDQASSLAFRGYDWRVVTRHATFSGNVGDPHLLHWESEKPLRVLAALNGDERNRATRQGGVQVSQLGPQARQAVEKWLVDSGAIFQGFRSQSQEDYGVKNLSGLPTRTGRDLRLSIAEKREPMTFQVGPGIPPNIPFSDYLEYSGGLYQNAVEDTPGVLVQMGTLRKIELRLTLPSGAFIAVEVDQAAAPASDSWTRPRELPAEVLKLLKDAFERSGGTRADDSSPLALRVPLSRQGRI